MTRLPALPAGLRLGCLLALTLGTLVARAEPWADRLVWVFGWGLGNDRDVVAIQGVLRTAAANGLNGAVLSAGLDTLCQRDEAWFRRLGSVHDTARDLNLELIPAVFSVGYGGGILAHDRHLAEGLPVVDAPFVARGSEARFVPDPNASLSNGGFEAFTGNRFAGHAFHDQPGEISFADTTERHSGRASIRFSHFTANPHGHGRVMQEVRVTPHRCYRLSLWVKTQGLQPTGAFRCLVLADGRELAPRTFNLPSTTDWRRVSYLFNSLHFDKVRLYAGLWGGRSGTVWLDDWTLEDAGPVNVLRRPGTPVGVQSEDGKTPYEEGRDFARFETPRFSPWRDDVPAVTLRLLPGSRISDGQSLRVSWYHPQLIHDSQITVCMAEPALDPIFDHEARLLAEHLHPRRVLLNMDEVRMGGTCRACEGRDMAQLLGECTGKQAAAIRRYSPDAQVYVWSDMFDPNHNAHGDYYLVAGDFSGSWRHLPKDLVMAVWGGEPRPHSLRFFAEQGFPMVVACYYDADDLQTVRDWMAAARDVPGVRGFMYTPWQRKYSLLPGFGKLLKRD